MIALLPVIRGIAVLPVIVSDVVPNGAVVLLKPLLDGSRLLPMPVTQIAADGPGVRTPRPIAGILTTGWHRVNPP